ncbi:hypothetical protein [Rhizobium sp. Root1204]|uniref:hypothetical protein n=1 Tax=Rhizobium sp. Root1204 TaxID=1736428 RepID=UPI0007146D52|nr:hypothetical protein [Rhizobium sp. Root1204]KQV41232.1 hypothetical protein ASC96_18185 [Rhizobium sp. Root1204]
MDDFDAAQFASEYASTPGQKLWQVLNRADVVLRMETASDLGQPALAPVEDILLEEIGEPILLDRFKQMAGRMTKQVLEARGFEHEVSDIRLNSVPFYKASRYRRRDQVGLFLFKNSSDPRDLCLVESRKGELLPVLSGSRWIYVNRVTSRLKAQVGYQFDLLVAVAIAKKDGYFRHHQPRLFRAPR